jgi:hypothetical protein
MLHGVGVLALVFEPGWSGGRYAVACTLGFGAASLARVGLPGFVVLAAWWLFWSQRLWIQPYFDPYLSGLLLISLYVLLRTIRTLQHEGADALRPGSSSVCSSSGGSGTSWIRRRASRPHAPGTSARRSVRCSRRLRCIGPARPSAPC